MADLVPTWWELLLGSLAAYRVWRLLAEDEILDTPRRRLLRYEGWRPGGALPDGYRARWADFLRCPWCSGFWVAVAGWLVWLAAPSFALVVATPFAASALVGLVRGNLDPPED